MLIFTILLMCIFLLSSKMSLNLSFKRQNKRHQRLAKSVSSIIQSKCQKEESNTVDVLKLVAKYLGVASEISFGGKNIIEFHLPFETRNTVWKFWEANSEESTLNTELARMKVTSKPKR